MICKDIIGENYDDKNGKEQPKSKKKTGVKVIELNKNKNVNDLIRLFRKDKDLKLEQYEHCNIKGIKTKLFGGNNDSHLVFRLYIK